MRSTIHAMRDELDDDQPQTPEEPIADAVGGSEDEEIAEGKKPGVTDFLKAAKDGAKLLKKQEP
jgi:hypothetical protein